MPAWTDKLLGRSPTKPAGDQQDGLPPELADYPPFTPRHPGSGPDFPLEHARENLEQLLAELPRRLEIVAPVLAAHGCDPRPALAGEDPRPFLEALWSWGGKAWLTWPQPWKASAEGWRRSDRAGPDIGLSFFTDVGLVLGETIRALRPEYLWEINSDRQDKEMTYFRQPELMLYAPDPKLRPRRLDFDVIDAVVHQASGSGMAWRNPIEALAADAVLGGQEAIWHLRGGVVPPSPDWDTWLARRGPPHPFADA